MPSRTAQTFPPPVMEARRWVDGVSFPADRPLINVSQAAPVDPPPPPLRAEMARLVMDDPFAHIYGPVLGLPELREEVAAQFSVAYDGVISNRNVAITSGCNQAFSATISALTDQGDEVIVPVPWYFNHKMWLDMAGVVTVPLATGRDLLPDPQMAAQLITARTRAIVLVTPNNPGGVEYPAPLIRAFAELARTQGLKLIVDETYRDFHSQTGAPHDLFTDPSWADTLVQLYSFSKSYRLTGHRVGAMVAHPDVLEQAERFLDTVAICAPQLGQRAALWGMRNLGDWLAGERLEILDRRAAIEDGVKKITDLGWQLLVTGAYFAYFEHPFDLPSDILAQRLVREVGILALPGTMFMPEGDKNGQRQMRIAFANIDRAAISLLYERLAAFTG